MRKPVRLKKDSEGPLSKEASEGIEAARKEKAKPISHEEVKRKLGL